VDLTFFFYKTVKQAFRYQKGKSLASRLAQLLVLDVGARYDTQMARVLSHTVKMLLTESVRPKNNYGAKNHSTLQVDE
jgi:hypothetical protein